MGTRRLLFVRSRRNAGAAPIWVALLSLVALSLGALLVALWQGDPTPYEHQRRGGDDATSKGSFQGASRPPPDARAPAARKVWM